ncbi:MAG: flagellar biosynthetic protein FliO [Candidatus Zixiibacteriota bacterium]
MNRKLKIQIAVVATLAALIFLLGFLRPATTDLPSSNETNPTLAVRSSHGQIESPVVQVKRENSSAWLSALKLAGAMIVVIGAIYGFLFLLRKMMGKRLSSNRNQRFLELLETTYIGQKKSISLVRFADRAILIGSSENNIAPLAELDSEETSRLLQETTPAKNITGFRSLLSDAREKYRTLNLRRMVGQKFEETEPAA